jgi:MFS family permease
VDRTPPAADAPLAPAPPAPAPPARRPALALASTLSVQAVATLALTAPAVMAPAVAPLLGMPAHRIGWFVGVAYAAAMLTGLVAGVHATRVGAIRLSRVALLGCAVGLLVAAAAAPTGWIVLVLVAGAAIGAGYGLANPTASLVLTRHAPAHRRGLFFSIKQTSVPIGVGTAGLLVPPLLAVMPWPGALAVIAVGCAALAAWLRRARVLDETPQRAAAPGAAESASTPLIDPLLQVWRSPPLRRLGVASLTFSMTQLCFVTFLVAHLTLERSYPFATAALVLSLSQVVAVVCRVLWGAVSDRWVTPSRMLGLLGVAMGASVALLGAHPDGAPRGVTLAIALACAATAVAWNGVFYAELAIRVRPDQMASASGAVQVLTFGGAMTGPMLFALAVSALGDHATAYLLLAGVPTAAGAWLLAYARD